MWLGSAASRPCSTRRNARADDGKVVGDGLEGDIASFGSCVALSR